MRATAACVPMHSLGLYIKFWTYLNLRFSCTLLLCYISYVPVPRPPLYKTLMTHSTNALVLNPDPLGRGILTQDYIPILISGAEQEG